MNWYTPSHVTWTHIPTGLSAKVEFRTHSKYQTLARASEIALKWLRAKVWGKDRDLTQRVRSWHLDPYLGSFVKDERTGIKTPVTPALLNPIEDQAFGELLCGSARRL